MDYIMTSKMNIEFELFVYLTYVGTYIYFSLNIFVRREKL